MIDEKSRQLTASRINFHAVLLYLGLLIAGLIGNYFKFHVLNLHFVFGSIFAMLALQFFGTARGIFAAAVISSYTFFEWNHPYAVVTMTAEVAVVGWLSHRRKLNMLMADVLYWLVIGIPIGYFCFHVIMQLPVSGSMFLMMKQSLNGISNVLIARLVYTGYRHGSKTSPISFREMLSNLLAFLVLFSTLSILIVSSKIDWVETDQSIRLSLKQDSNRITRILENWLEDKELAIVNLARLASNHTAVQMQTPLDLARASHNSLLRIALLDETAKVIAYSPSFDENGRSAVGISYADRSHFKTLKQTLEPVLSKVVVSQFSHPDPVVVMVAPVLDNGRYKGAVGGLLSFDRIKSLLETNIEGQAVLFTLLDEDSNVIVTNYQDQEVMKPLRRGNGTLSGPLKIPAPIFRPSPLSTDNGLMQWIPALPANTSTIELWGRSRYVAESGIGRLAEWRLILEQPVTPDQNKLYDRYTKRFILLFVVLVFSILIAEIASRRFARSSENLSAITRDLPAKLESGKMIEWPESRILENRVLIDNFRTMAQSLLSRFNEIGRINNTLERKVESRTHELRVSEEKLSRAATMACLGYWEYDVTDDLFIFNDQFYRIFKTTAEQVGGYTMPFADYARRFIPLEDANRLREGIRKTVETADSGSSYQLDHRILRSDGTTGYISVQFFSVNKDNGRTIETFGINQDITERKLTEDRLRSSLNEKQTLLDEINHRVKNNMQVIASLLKLQQNKKDKRDVDSVLQKNIGRVYTMAAIHESLHQSEKLSEIDLKAFIQKLTDMLAQVYPTDAGKIKFIIDIPDLKLGIDKASPLGLVMNELISNSLKYAFPGENQGKISIAIYPLNGTDFELHVADDGLGMPEDYDWKNEETLGLRLVKTLVEDQLNGSIEFRNQNGASFTIRFNLESDYK